MPTSPPIAYTPPANLMRPTMPARPPVPAAPLIPVQPPRPPAVTAGVAVAPTVSPDVGPKPMSSPKPPYPLEAFKARQEGRAVLELEVLEDGGVGRVRLARTSGFDALDQSALETVKTWKYSPAQKNGQIVKQWLRISVSFEMSTR